MPSFPSKTDAFFYDAYTRAWTGACPFSGTGRRSTSARTGSCFRFSGFISAGLVNGLALPPPYGNGKNVWKRCERGAGKSGRRKRFAQKADAPLSAAESRHGFFRCGAASHAAHTLCGSGSAARPACVGRCPGTDCPACSSRDTAGKEPVSCGGYL